MRLTKSLTKKALKSRAKRHLCKSTDGPTCPVCEPHVNSSLRRQTILGRIHAKEMQER